MDSTSSSRLTSRTTRRALAKLGAKLAAGAALVAAGFGVTRRGTEAIVCDFTATLNGANETDGNGNFNQGDPDGRGQACIDLRPGRMCWRINVGNVGAVQAAHIHRGRFDQNGPVRIDFNGQLSGCKAVPQSLLDAIAANPSVWYVNIHTGQFSAGAIRGQLS